MVGRSDKKNRSIEATDLALDGDLDGFFKVEAHKQTTVVLCVLPSAWGLTLEKAQEILEIILLEENKNKMVATIIIGIIVALIIIAVVIKLVKNKKAGKGSCSCGCGGCAMKDCCSGDKKANTTTSNKYNN